MSAALLHPNCSCLALTAYYGTYSWLMSRKMRCLCCCALQTLRDCHAEQHYLGAIAPERVLVEPVISLLDLTQGKPVCMPMVKPSSVPEWAICSDKVLYVEIHRAMQRWMFGCSLV